MLSQISKRVSYDLLDDELKQLVSDKFNIKPIANYEDLLLGNPDNNEYVRILGGSHKNEIYVWTEEGWQLIGADDLEIHEDDIIGLDKYTKAEIDDLLSSKADINHIHETFLFEQLTPTVAWTISHPLCKYPNVEIVDSTGKIIIGDVQYISTSVIKIFFEVPFSGKAYLN